jgi:hypothetical protein
MAACAAALDPVQADAYLPALEQFNFIISHLRSTGPTTHSEVGEFAKKPCFSRSCRHSKRAAP